MQKIVLLALLLVAASAFEWKTYSKSIEEQVNSKQTTWTAGHNAYFDSMNLQDIKHLMGTYKTPAHMKLNEKVFDEVKLQKTLAAMPDEFDPREEWPLCQSIKEIRDQSNCGSCWAFGTVEAISDRICITSKQKNQTRISSENLLSCCTGLFACGMGCNGGYTDAAWSYFKKTGLVTGNLYDQNQYCQPYAFPPCDHHVTGQYPPCEGSMPTPKCVTECNSEFDGSYKNDMHYGKTSYSVPRNEEKIQAELFENGSATASFQVYEDFLTYTGGVYQHSGSGFPLGGHAVKIMGWGVENGTPYWLCANSWNQDWGLKGFFKILRGKNECGIENGIVAGEVNA